VLRRQIRQVVSEPVGMPAANDSDSDAEQKHTGAENVSASQQLAREVDAAVAHVKLVHDVRVALTLICPALSDLVYKFYGPDAFRNRLPAHPVLKEFLRQVSNLSRGLGDKFSNDYLHRLLPTSPFYNWLLFLLCTSCRIF